MADDFQEKTASGENPQVRVMSESERRDYAGVTIEEGTDGQAQGARSQMAGQREAYERYRRYRSFGSSSFGQAPKGFFDGVMRNFLGRYWKFKLVAVGAGLLLALAFFALLPVLSLLFVVFGVLYLAASLFGF